MIDGITRRRAIGGGLALVLSGSSGPVALEREDADPLDDLPEPVRAASFEWSRDASEHVDDEIDPSTEYPRPRIREVERGIDVRGVLRYGSGTCNEISVTELSSDAERSEIRVEIGWRETAPESESFIGTRACTDDLDVGSYELRLEFDAAPPPTVRAIGTHRAPSEDDSSESVSTRYRPEDPSRDQSAVNEQVPS